MHWKSEGKAVIAGVDIGGTKIAAGVVDDTGKVLAKLECPTNAAAGYASALARTIDMLRTASRKAEVQITGIGIGSTGIVYPRNGAFGDAGLLPGWRGNNLVDDLSREFRVTVALENDGDASALGEAAWGAGKTKARLIYVTVGTGIGGGIILNKQLYRGAGMAHPGNTDPIIIETESGGTGIGGGIILNKQLYRGADMAHPEIGHHVIEASGPECCCGYRGCWEALATGPAMAAWFNTNAPDSKRNNKELSAAQISELARCGDELAKRAVEREILYLGLGVANLINLFVPDVIVFGGSMMKSADLFLDGIRKVIRRGCRFVPAEKTELILASLGDDANLIGAARVWHYRFVENGGSL